MKKFAFLIVITCFIVAGLTAQQNNMVRINGGTFTMGYSEMMSSEMNRGSSEEDELFALMNFRRAIEEALGKTRLQVTVSSFRMSRYPITQKEYQEIMGTNPSSFKGDNFPVEEVSWFDAIEYCNRRSQKEGLTPAYTITGRTPATGYPITAATITWNRNANGYRLPTEAEWEYACKAGTITVFNTGNKITHEQANFGKGAERLAALLGKVAVIVHGIDIDIEFNNPTTPVGSYPANAYGLYDMHGNVSEWCWDWYGTYQTGAQTNPTGAVSGNQCVMRGGCFLWSYFELQSVSRRRASPNISFSSVGFRVVRP